MADITVHIPQTPEAAFIKAEEASALKKTLVKLAFVAAALVLNQFVLSYVFVYAAIALGVRNLDAGSLYFVSMLVNELSAYVFPALAVFAVFKNERENPVPFKKYGGYRAIEIPLFFTVMLFVGSLATIITNIIAEWLDSVFSTGEITDALQSIAPDSAANYWVFVFFVCVVGPVCEELIFRKLLLTPLRRCGDGFAVIVTALVFGIYHGNFDQFPYAVAVGFFLALIAVRSNSIIPSVILHIANNAFVSFSDYTTEIFGDSGFARLLDNILGNLYFILFWAGLVLLWIMAAFRFFRFERRNLLLKREKAGIILRCPAAYIAFVLMILILL